MVFAREKRPWDTGDIRKKANGGNHCRSSNDDVPSLQNFSQPMMPLAVPLQPLPLRLPVALDTSLPRYQHVCGCWASAFPCTAPKVKHAFRARAKVMHPDSGGSNEAFQTLYQVYKDALALVK